MAVDLFVGSVPRYLTGNWETPIQSFARDQGIKHNRIGPTPELLSTKAAIDAAAAFESNLGVKLGSIRPLSQSENAPYRALQLTAQSLAALVLSAGHLARPELPLPRRLPSNIQESPVVAEASAKEYYLGPMAIFEAHVFVVGAESRICGVIGPRSREIIVATTAALDFAISELSTFFSIDRDALDQIFAKGPPEAGLVLHQEENQWARAGEVYHFDEVRTHALWGLACFNEAISLAKKTAAVIIRDD